MNNAQRFALYSPGYAETWRSMTIRRPCMPVIEKTVAAIMEHRERYEAVEKATGVPWYVIGIIHKMESQNDIQFRTHLHNGDPLTARTRLIPRGRPATGSPPFTWEESAIDALKLKNLQAITEWSVERIAFELERYNGFGYRTRGVPSPYLWSFSTAYTSGKFVADGKYSASAVSKQSGGMVLLFVLKQKLGLNLQCGKVEAPEIDEREKLPPAAPPSLLKSRTVLGTILAALSWPITKAAEYIGSLDVAGLVAAVAGEATAFAGPLSQLAGMIGVGAVWIGGIAFAYGLAVVVYARIHDYLNGVR